MENKNLFEVGIRVWDTKYGWGVVKDNNYSGSFPIAVKFDNIYFGTISYTEDGRNVPEANRTLFFEEVVIPKSALERPRKSAKQMLEECEEAEYDYEKLNYRLIRTDNGGIISDWDTTHMIIGVKYISFKDAVRIIEECRENHKEEN